MSKDRPSLIKACFVSSFVIIFVLTCVIVLAIAIVPARAEEVFGHPAPELDYRERLTYSAILLWHKEELTQPLNPVGTDITLNIEYGESITSIIDQLWEHDLISDTGVFRTYLEYAGLDTTLQAGEHTLSQRWTPIEIAQALQDAIPTHVTFVVIPGWRMEEIAAALPTSGLTFSKDEFLELAADPPSDFVFFNNFPTNATLEGFFYPDSYHLLREISAEEFIFTLVSNFNQHISQDIRQGMNRQDLDLFHGTILASIVEREAILKDEKPLISSVFLNRLALGMPLESDPTVQYAIGYNHNQETWWTNPLTLFDLKINSMYNTYLYPELPPGPIANPDLESLRAVAFPAQTPYLYFRALCDQSGRHTFSETFEEHLDKACP